MRRERIAIALLAAVLFTACREVPAGARGVLFQRLGGGTEDRAYGEGLHIVPPWNYMVLYDIRRQDREEAMEILTSNGLAVRMDFSVRYFPIPEELPTLHQTVGRNYYDVIIRPSVRSTVRRVVGRYTPEQIYSSKRDEIQAAIFEGILEAVEGKNIRIEAALIRNVILPKKLQSAIEEKLQEEQRSERMRFTLDRERQEADRKRIEAQGIADFQKIVSEGISDELLRWKGIEATEDLASSENSKIVVIGSGKHGLPLILGGGN